MLNQLPTQVLEKITPFEAWHGKKPETTLIRIFGSVCYSLVPDERRRKLDDKGELGIFLGYSTETKGYQVYMLSSRKLMIRRDVVIDEGSHWNWAEEKIERDEVGKLVTGGDELVLLHSPLSWKMMRKLEMMEVLMELG